MRRLFGSRSVQEKVVIAPMVSEFERQRQIDQLGNRMVRTELRLLQQQIANVDAWQDQHKQRAAYADLLQKVSYVRYIPGVSTQDMNAKFVSVNYPWWDRVHNPGLKSGKRLIPFSMDADNQKTADKLMDSLRARCGIVELEQE